MITGIMGRLLIEWAFHRFIEHGGVSQLLEEIGLTTEHVMERICLLTPKKEKGHER